MIDKNYTSAYLPSDHARHQYVVAMLAVTTLVLVGTGGYMIVEGWGFLDALYMTAITLSTVGYSEIHPLSDAGRWFTIFLIFVGVWVATAVFTILANLAVERQTSWILKRRKMQASIDKLSDHVIFCGFGRLSRIAVRELSQSSFPMVIIDKDEDAVTKAREEGFLAVHGDASADEVLLEAGVDRACRLVSLLPTDSENLYVILTCRELNPSIFIISRSEDDLGERRLKRAGANRIMAPYRVGGMKIAEGLLRPYVTEFLDIAASSGASELEIEEIKIPSTSPLHGVRLRDSGIREHSNIIVAAIIPRNGAMLFNPSGETVIEAGSTLIGMGLRKDFVALEGLLLGDHDMKEIS